MFESVKQGSRADGIVYATSLLLSLIAHVIILCLLIVVPLIFFNALQAEELVTFLIDPPAPPAPPPPPSPPVKSAGAIRHTQAGAPFLPPSRIPDGLPPADDFSEQVSPEMFAGGIPGIAGPGQAGVTGKALEGLLVENPPVLPPPPPPIGKGKAPVRVGVLEQSKLIVKVSPVYPELAIKARVSGDVILEAFINEEGAVSSVKILSGHPLLVNAAVEAVKQWRYSPTVLSGEPVPIIAVVTVVFKLN